MFLFPRDIFFELHSIKTAARDVQSMNDSSRWAKTDQYRQNEANKIYSGKRSSIVCINKLYFLHMCLHTRPFLLFIQSAEQITCFTWTITGQMRTDTKVTVPHQWPNLVLSKHAHTQHAQFTHAKNGQQGAGIPKAKSFLPKSGSSPHT